MEKSEIKRELEQVVNGLEAASGDDEERAAIEYARRKIAAIIAELESDSSDEHPASS